MTTQRTDLCKRGCSGKRRKVCSCAVQHCPCSSTAGTIGASAMSRRSGCLYIRCLFVAPLHLPSSAQYPPGSRSPSDQKRAQRPHSGTAIPTAGGCYWLATATNTQSVLKQMRSFCRSCYAAAVSSSLSPPRNQANGCATKTGGSHIQTKGKSDW
jgi:hypothetical protein